MSKGWGALVKRRLGDWSHCFPPGTVSRDTMHQSPASYPSMTSDPPLSQPDLLRIP